MHAKTPQAIDGRYTYYAFISYSHKDARWAKWLQKKLETYKLPTTLAENESGSGETPPPGKLTPIFRDETDLNTGPLKAKLQEALLASKYLIILCSPSSAASPYVGYEVEAFRANGGEDRIIPLILRGEVGAENPQEECYAPALREMDDPIVGVDAQKLSRRDVLLKIVSRMLGLRFDELKRRDEARERKKRRRRGLALSCAALVCLVGGYLAWDYFVPKVRYYEDYVEVAGLPVGLRPLDRDDLAERLHIYEITTTRGKVRQLRTINALNGQLHVENDSMNMLQGILNPLPRHQIIHYAYYDDGRLSTVEMRDANDCPLLTYEYSAGMTYMAFKASAEGDESVMMPAGVSSGMDPLWGLGKTDEDRSDIIQHELTFDEAGCLVRSMFMRSNRDYTRDPQGVAGLAYAYNDRGQITAIDYLDMDGKPYTNAQSIAGVRYGYDDLGRCVSRWSVGPGGDLTPTEGGMLRLDLGYEGRGRLSWMRETYAMDFAQEARYTYDDDADVIDTRFYNGDGAPANIDIGCAGIRVAYNADGFPWQITYLDLEEAPTATAVTPARHTLTLDERGNPLTVSLYDAQGNSVFGEEGAAHFRNTYDANGWIIRQETLNDEGAPQIDAMGTAQTIYDHDGEGRLTRVAYFDAQGEPTLNVDGIASFEKAYDERGNVAWEAYLGVDGRPAYYRGLSARVDYAYDEAGRLLSESYWDVDGRPAQDADGAARNEYGYDERGYRTMIRRLDGEGNLYMGEGTYALLRQDYDERGNLIREECYDEYERPIYFGREGACVEYAYDRHDRVIEIRKYTVDRNMRIMERPYFLSRSTYDDAGNLVTVAYLDGEGEPVLYQGLFHQVRFVYDARGRQTEFSYWDIQGKPAESTSGFWRNLTVWDEWGSPVEERYYAADGSFLLGVIYTYDPAGRMLSETWTDEAGHPMEIPEDYTRRECVYDDYGNLIRDTRYDAEMRPVFTSVSPILEYAYDEAHRVISQKDYDEDGELMVHVEFEYDERGRNIRKRQPYMAPELVEPGQEGALQVEMRYDERGNEIYWALMDKDGNRIHNTNGLSAVRYAYDGRNNLVEVAYFDAQDNPVLTEYGYARIEYYIADAYGNKSRRGWAIFDEHGEEIPENQTRLDDADYVCISEVTISGQAHSQGVREDDIVLEYGYLRFYDQWEDFAAYIDAFDEAISTLSCEPKILVVYRPSDDAIHAFSFGEGTLGVRFSSSSISQYYHETYWELINVHVRGLYEDWLAQFAQEAS